MAPAKLLIDYNAARDDDVSKMGQLNLEKERKDKPKSNSKDLYIKMDTDWRGTKCAHFHRKKDYIRAEMHALAEETKAGETYFIGYEFALGATPNSLMVWQWKEFVANVDGGANIPLSLEIKSGKLQLGYAEGSSARQSQWSTAVKSNTVYKIGLEILAKKSGGHVKLYLNGEQQKLANGDKVLTGNMFPGRSDPKIGIYRGEQVETDSFVYLLQIGTEKQDVDQGFF